MRRLFCAWAVIAVIGCGEAPSAPAKTPPPVATVAPPLACEAGRADCDGDRANACETDVDFQEKSCGACGVVCGAGERCVFGRCSREGVIATAMDHTCAVADGGGARCWGNNLHGQLGDGTRSETAARWGAVRAAGLSDVVMVATGGEIAMGSESCALLRTGKISCWGFNSGAAPSSVAGWEGAVDLAVSTGRVCGVLRDGTLRCADLTERGDYALPIYERIGDVSDAVQVCMGNLHQCALRRSGEVLCWGSPGAAAAWKNVQRLDASTVVGRIAGVASAVQLSCGIGHECVVLRDGHVRCWGDDDYGQSTGGGRDGEPIPGLADAVEVSAGVEHTCALRKSGGVSCWGHGSSGELGNGQFADSAAPVDVAGLTDATHVSVSYQTSCATRATGAPVCWGKYGSLGSGRTAQRTLTDVKDARAVRIVSESVCALNDKGHVQCYNATPGEAAIPQPGLALSDVAALPTRGGDDERFCAVKKTGKVDCWGRDADGKPFTLTGLGPARSVKLGSRNTMVGIALLTSGSLSAFALPVPEDVPQGPFPANAAPVPGFSRVQAIVGGASVACALLASSEVHCFEPMMEKDGKVTVGKRLKLEVPPVAGIVSRDDEYILIQKDGTVSRFGLEDANKAPSITKVPGIQDAVDAALGPDFTCVRHGSGEVSCWGKNAFGQLGTGDFATHAAPAKVKGLTDAVAIDAGDFSMCAVHKDGRLDCWGDLFEPTGVPHPVPVVDDGG